MQRVFASLNDGYYSSADDVAREYVAMVRRDPALTRTSRANRPLCDLLIRLFEEGWTTSEAQTAIRYLKGV